MNRRRRWMQVQTNNHENKIHNHEPRIHGNITEYKQSSGAHDSNQHPDTQKLELK